MLDLVKVIITDITDFTATTSITVIMSVMAVVSGAGLGCAPAMEPVGITHTSAAPPPTTSASAAAPPWKHEATFKKLPRANARRFPSTGHLFGRYDADVFVNEPARAVYAAVGPGHALPEGALLVEVHLAKDGTPGPVFAMEKLSSGWSFIELDAKLRPVRQGRLSPCVECHAHVASQDHVFGVPSTGL
ncbi:MAG: hypothetical protein HYV09_04680 [Deltaproteobacteria bacterium]|nr:hypothetical protein [Deltaproteobacteria bacterium]